MWLVVASFIERSRLKKEKKKINKKNDKSNKNIKFWYRKL